jgi:hypothetical protein
MNLCNLVGCYWRFERTYYLYFYVINFEPQETNNSTQTTVFCNDKAYVIFTLYTDYFSVSNYSRRNIWKSLQTLNGKKPWRNELLMALYLNKIRPKRACIIKEASTPIKIKIEFLSSVYSYGAILKINIRTPSKRSPLQSTYCGYRSKAEFARDFLCVHWQQET